MLIQFLCDLKIVVIAVSGIDSIYGSCVDSLENFLLFDTLGNQTKTDTNEGNRRASSFRKEKSDLSVLFFLLNKHQRNGHDANTSDNGVVVRRIQKLFVLSAIDRATRRYRQECFCYFSYSAFSRRREPETIVSWVCAWAFPPRHYSFRIDQIVFPIRGFFPLQVG